MVRMPWDKNWERLYDALGVRDFFDFITFPHIQEALFPIKLVFIFFAFFFFCAVIYFYVNSSYLRYQILQDTTEFFSWQSYGTREINRRWKSIIKRAAAGSEKDYKIAIVEADYLLEQVLENADYQGNTFEERVESAGKKNLPNWKDILQAHKVRNLVVHEVNYTLDLNAAKKLLQEYERAIKSIYSL